MSENVFIILKKNGLSMCALNREMYEYFRKATGSESEAVKKIRDYENHAENNHSKYSDEIMQAVRQNVGMERFDYSEDENLERLSPDKIFECVLHWNGLLGGYSEVIKSWVKEIYGVDLNDANNVK